jgi:hypothetical protein
MALYAKFLYVIDVSDYHYYNMKKLRNQKFFRCKAFSSYILAFLGIRI